jgi:hypothetical protein
MEIIMPWGRIKGIRMKRGIAQGSKISPYIFIS